MRSALPVAAGLGSSAAFSVCIASALIYVNGLLALPKSDATLHRGRLAIPSNHTKVVNDWAFVAERINHGNPSGVDNAVASHGGAIVFRRPAELEPLSGYVGSDGAGHLRKAHRTCRSFKAVRFLLTDTTVPRETMKMVAGVGALRERAPHVVEPILEAIQSISDQARRCLLDAELDREQQLEILSVRVVKSDQAFLMLTKRQALIVENHDLLVRLGVSHPALEVVKAKAESEPYRLATKLTGAGGGGVAFSLVPDGEFGFSETRYP